MDEMESFLTAVDEYVDDENKIVTYKWLSQQLALHVNKARHILSMYLENSRKGSNEITATYSLTGRNSKGLIVNLVRDFDLESAKNKLAEVHNISIYSIQKMKLEDSSLLYSSDYELNRENLHLMSRFGGITYQGSARLPKEELQEKMSVGGAGESSEPAKQQQIIPSKTEKKKKTPQANFFANTKVSPPKVKEENKSVPVLKRAKELEVKKTKKASGVAAFMTKEKSDPFAKLAKPKTVVKKEPGDVAKETATLATSKIAKTTKNIEQTERKDHIPDDLRIDDFPSDNSDDDDFATKKEDRKAMDDKKAEDEVKENRVQKRTQNKKTSKPRKKSRSDSNELPAKKRRRIKELSSSSDEDDFQDELMDVPPSPPPVTVPKDVEEEEMEIATTNTTKNRRKKKVLKSHSFQDEDGTMVTEKVWEFESCSSEDEAPATNGKSSEARVPPAESKKSSAKNKISPPSETRKKKHSKQSSIMGFFNKN